MNNLRLQKHKNKSLKMRSLELEKIFKPSNISINDMDKSKKRTSKKRTFTKKYLMQLVQLSNAIYS